MIIFVYYNLTIKNMFNTHFKTLRSRVHLYIVTVLAFAISLQITQASAYLWLEVEKNNSHIEKNAIMLQVEAAK